MARYHDIEASFWEDFQAHGKNAKLLYLFAFSNPSTRDSGLYRISEGTILLNTGLSKNDFDESLKELEGKIYYDAKEKVMFVAGKFKRRLSGLLKNKNLLLSVQHDLEEFSSSFVSRLFIEKYQWALKGLSSPSLPLPLPVSLNSFGKHENLFFEEIWKQFPAAGRLGKKEAFRHYKASVKTEDERKLIQLALAKYRRHLEVNTWKKPQNAKTWFNNWRDWVEFQEPEIPEAQRIKTEDPTRDSNNEPAFSCPPPGNLLDLVNETSQNLGRDMTK